MRKVSDKERDKLSAEIADLESLDLHQLRVQWKLLSTKSKLRHI
jgi:hypothetical protein